MTFLFGRREWSGRMNLKTGEKELDYLSVHYALMNAQEESVTRLIPLPVVLYHLYLKVVHSGMTVDEILSLPEGRRAQFYGESLQITCSAGLFPYEKDFKPGVALSLWHGIGITAVGTEDMVRSVTCA